MSQKQVRSVSLYDLCRVIRVTRLSLCKYESREIYLNNESRNNGNESWDAYLESVQNGLDYVLGICKCLRVSNCLSIL